MIKVTSLAYNKNAVLAFLALVTFTYHCDVQPALAASSGFVEVRDKQFYIDDKPYRYVGANMWYAAYLGSTEKDIGDRSRLLKELDLLKEHGVDNLRILGAAETSPLLNSMRPAISNKGAVTREDILIGLDFALSEMAKRDMKAIIYLNNFWEWSGGMATYLYWADGEIVDMADPEKPWPAFALFTSQFYSNEKAVAMFEEYAETLLTRRNSITGKLYRDDPTIMSWQLANEPRPGDGQVSRTNLPAYQKWISGTAAMIKSMAPKQLVSVGSEGTMGCLEMPACFMDAHENGHIDYATFHMWLKNWGWYDASDPQGTFQSALKKAENYVAEHVSYAEQLNMPIVLEEFGLERDGGAFLPGSSVDYRNQYFKFVFSLIESNAPQNGPLIGSNFWSWGGFGKASHDDSNWRTGDKSYVGDPPQEPQGLNSVFASDLETLAILKQHHDALTSDSRAQGE